MTDVVHHAWCLFQTCQEVERILMVISVYEDMGISGNVHDLEHRSMLKDAIARRQRLLAKLRNDIMSQEKSP